MTQSLEDYLETIYLIIQTNKVARVKEISERMNVKKPSAINAIKELGKRGLLHHEKYGYIELTDEGIKAAEIIFEKHKMIKKFLIDVLGVSEEVAENDACQMEHILTKETLDSIEKFMTKNKA